MGQREIWPKGGGYLCNCGGLFFGFDKLKAADFLFVRI